MQTSYGCVVFTVQYLDQRRDVRHHDHAPLHRLALFSSCATATAVGPVVMMRILLACIAMVLPATGGFMATNRMHRATRLQPIRHDAWPRCLGPLPEGESESRTPRVSIEYCTRCNWMREWGGLDPCNRLCLAQPRPVCRRLLLTQSLWDRDLYLQCDPLG